MKHVQIEWAGDTAIDGQAKPAGEFHIKEFEDDEWVGGCVALAQEEHRIAQTIACSSKLYGLSVTP